MARAKSIKKSCVICEDHFSPNVHLGDRQKTCGSTSCKREWHRRLCKKWNKKNPEYFKDIYLARKLAKIVFLSFDTKHTCPCRQPTKKPIPKSRIELGLPRETIQEVIGAKALVIVEYIIENIFRRLKNRLGSCLPEVCLRL